MAIAQFARKTGNYQFPTSALTTVQLPHIGEAIAEAERVFFERNHAFLVDAAQHSAFCANSYKSGLLRDEDMEAFAASPRLLELHRLTNKAVKSLGGAVRFTKKNLFVDLHRLETVLSSASVDKAVVAEVALGMVKAGALDASDLHDLVAKGDYTAPLVLQKCDDVFADLADGDGLTHVAGVSGSGVVIESYQPTYYDFSLSGVPADERAELSVLMQKTFDAISTFAFPLHTPASFVGKHSYFSPAIEEALSALEAITNDFSPDGLIDLLSPFTMDDLPFDGEVIGLCDDVDAGGICQESLARGVEILASTKNCHANYSYSLDGDDIETKALEVKSLTSQAKELAASGKSTASICSKLVEILEYILSLSDSPLPGYKDMDTSDEEGLGFFETFIIRLDESEVQDAYDEAYSYIDCMMNEVGPAALVVEAQRDVVARSVVATMGAIKKVNTLLCDLSAIVEETYA